MKLKKITAAVLTAICLSTTVSTVASATPDTDYADTGMIAPAYEIANSVSSNLVINGTTGYCTSSVSGDNVVSITVTQTLQKHWGLWIWNSVSGAEWSKTVSYGSTTLSSSKSSLDDGTYRVKSVFKLTNSNGKTESITVYSDECRID